MLKKTIMAVALGLIIGCTPIGNSKLVRIIVTAITGG